MAILCVSLVIELTIARAQSRPSGDPSSSEQASKRRVLLYPGYVLLPEGYQAFKNKSGVDTWSGYIVSPAETLRIVVYGGMVASPFAYDEDKFVWTRVESVSNSEMKVGLNRTDAGEKIVASVGWVNFTAQVRRQSDIDSFLEIVRSYKDEEYPGCEKMLTAPPPNNTQDRTRTRLTPQLKSHTPVSYDVNPLPLIYGA